MKSLGALLLLYRAKLAPMAAMLLLPWIWALPFVPWWVSAIALALVIPALFAILYFVMPAPAAPRRDNDSVEISNDEIARMRETSSGMNDLLIEWLNVSGKAQQRLIEVRSQLTEIITHTESSVIDISNNFRAITGKTRAQMEYAMNLLQSKQDEGGIERNAVGDAVAKWLSLPDYIRAYEDLLNSITERLMQYAAGTHEMVKEQGKVRENAIMVVDLLDEVRSMARQISMLALSTSVSPTGTVSHQQEFIEMADKIRDISDRANDLNHRIREHLDSIRDEMSSTHGAMNRMADEAREAAKQTKADVAQLTITMMMKTGEVGKTLENINSLSQEIQRDINQIIIALQFQDINQQKLERLKGPVLAEVTGALQAMTKETDMLSRKLNLQVGQGAAAKSQQSLAGAVGPAAALPPEKPGSDHVELF